MSEPKITVTKSGRQPPANRGSRKGIPNKITADLKQMILDALDQNGGVAYLADKAESHPAAFMALIGKVLPMQVTGVGDGPIQVLIGQLGKSSLPVKADDDTA